MEVLAYPINSSFYPDFGQSEQFVIKITLRKSYPRFRKKL